MIISLLIGIFTFLVLLTLMAYYDYRVYRVEIRLNRQLVKPEETKYSMFKSLGKTYDRVTEMLKKAGLKISTDDFIYYFLCVCLVIIAYAAIKNQITYAIIAIVFLVFAVRFALNIMESNLKFKIEKEFGLFVSDLAVMLRAEPNLAQAIEDVNKDTNPALKGYIDQVVTNVNAGMSIEAALKKLKDELSYSRIVSSWIDSIIYANITGSNLTEVCKNSAEKVNEKLQRTMKIKSLTARTKGIIVAVLGIIILTIFMILTSSADFISAYTTFVGHIVMLYVILSLTITTYVILRSIDKMSKM